MNLNNKKSTLIFSAVILTAVIFINLIGRNWFLRFDLTDNKMYSLSSSSKSVVQKIDDLFTIKVYFSADLPAQYSNNKRYLQDILEEYTAYSSGNLRFEFYSPENEEQIADFIGADWLVYQDLDDLIECAVAGNEKISSNKHSSVSELYSENDLTSSDEMDQVD